MKDEILGIHHITGISNDAIANVDFYTKTLGFKLIKKTVNFDDPTAYHLYYGDEVGSPGSVITFFIYEGSDHGKIGNGCVSKIGMGVKKGSLDYWKKRLKAYEVYFENKNEKIVFEDPDGLALEIIESDININKPVDNDVPEEHQIKGFARIEMLSSNVEETKNFLIEMGFENKQELISKQKEVFVIKESTENVWMGKGSIHHIAFNTKDSKTQEGWKSYLEEHDYMVSEVMERFYFRSIYFQEPGGVLFEIATNGPGFTVDEKVSELGSSLVLPKWLETSREFIEKHLPEL